ncbi:MAG TPA: MarR family transcriptional regulator [Mycobacteriales bacterium]|jgi:DNA-binding MarR family transcriptional regulator|nr:MarR family transcriptional regulator [Mycobacteriales bacterium]
MTSPPGPPADVDHLGLYVGLSDAVLRMTKLLGELAVERYEVPLKGVYLLLRLDDAGSLRVTELADEVYVSTSAASRTLDRLFAHGLVHREPAGDDGRATAVTLTPAGRRLARRARREMSERVRDLLFGELSGADLDQLGSLLSRLSDPLRPDAPAARPRPSPGRR